MKLDVILYYSETSVDTLHDRFTKVLRLTKLMLMLMT